MLVKTIEYEDYDGNKRKEDFYFNLSKAELMEMELSETGGLENLIKEIINTQDTPKIIELFKKIILKAFGVKSADGKRFVKTDMDGNPLWRQFVETEAYSELFMELSTNADSAAEFINKIIPRELSEKASEKSELIEQYKKDILNQ